MSAATLAVTVKPGSKKPGIEIVDGAVVLRVRERAIEGAANDACIRALAKLAGIPPSHITLLRGARSRQKLFVFEGVTNEELTALLSS